MLSALLASTDWIEDGNDLEVDIVTSFIGPSGGLLPIRRKQRRKIGLVAHARKAAEQVRHVGQGVFAVALAGDDDGVDNGGSLAGTGRTDKIWVWDVRRWNWWLCLSC